jgi:hypothetical protein
LSTGYHLVLPWKQWPRHEQLRIEARFTLGEGLTFETDKDVKVRLVPGARSNPPAMPPPQGGPALEPSALPSSLKGNRAPLTPASNWEPGPLGSAVHLGRPEPLQPFLPPQLP